MPDVEWTMERLCRFVQGATVVTRDALGNNVEPADWIRAEAGALSEESWLEQMQRIHPWERRRAAHVWWQISTEQRGVVREVVLRSELADGWHRQRLSIVNLLDHDEVGAVVWRTDQDERIGPVDDADLAFSEPHESPPWAILYLDRTGMVRRADGMVEELYGRPPEAVVGRPAMKFVHSGSHGTVMAMWPEVLADPDQVRTVVARLFRPDRTKVWVESTVVNQLHLDAGLVMWVSHDITERRAREDALVASREEATRWAEESRRLADDSRRMAEEFRTLAEQMPSAVFRAGPEGDISFGNAHWFTLTAPCGPAVRLRDIVRADRRGEVDEVVAALASPAGPDMRTLEVPDAGGTRLFSLTCRAVGEPGAGPRSVIGEVRDVTATAELRSLAEKDQLTGVLNRHALDRCLATAVRDRPDGLLLVFLDLDGFKEVNDEHGHDAGDVVLRTVAARLHDAVRPSDDIGRYGGDEFVIVCHGVAAGAEVFIVDRVEAAMGRPVHFTGGRWSSGASIGIARLRVGDSAAALLQRADRSMYRTKRARRTGAVHHASGPDPGSDGA